MHNHNLVPFLILVSVFMPLACSDTPEGGRKDLTKGLRKRNLTFNGMHEDGSSKGNSNAASAKGNSNAESKGSSNGNSNGGNSNSNTIRMTGQGRAKGRTMEGIKVGRFNEMNFVLGANQDCRIQVLSNVQDQELTITRIGNDKSNVINDDDRIFMKELVATMMIEQGDSWEVDTMASQIERASGLLSEWPQDLDIAYEYDKAADEARMQERIASDLANPVPADAPEPLENTAAQTSVRRLGEEQGYHHGRRLVTELCGSLNTFVQSTHDDFSFGRGNDRTTYNAFVSNHPACSATDQGTWFWTNGAWQCVNPDHDPNIEFAFGNCFARCGGGCGDDNGRGTYTRDCLDHDNCVRFGHNIASPFCNDEFLTTLDDAIWGSRCI